MKNRKLDPRLMGLLLLVLVIMGTGIYYQKAGAKPALLRGYLGGEKIGLFEDEEIKAILRKDYKIELDYSKAGSLDMVQLDQTGRDYLFPSSQTALEFYKEEKGTPLRSEIIFNTPIVLYSHKMVAEAFAQKGLVTKENGVFYLDMKKLAEMISAGTSWADVGLPELYGNVSIDTTDPSRSNSGNMFAGLLANALNGGKTADEQSLREILPELNKIFANLGYMETSSADLFSQFLKMGVGAKPVIAGYESQLLEFSVEQPDDFQKIRDDIVILYPSPTVWSTHVYIALTEHGSKGIDGLLDKKVQELAWTKHGFRTSIYRTGETQSSFQVEGLAADITKVMPMPDYRTMKQITDSLMASH